MPLNSEESRTRNGFLIFILSLELKRKKENEKDVERGKKVLKSAAIKDNLWVRLRSREKNRLLKNE